MSHPVLERLRAPDATTRREACAEAANDPAAVVLVDALCECLADSDVRVARAASDALTDIGRRDGGVRTALDATLRRGPEPARRRAALVWTRLEPPPAKLLPVLVDALEAPEGDERWAAARALAGMGGVQPEVLPLLVALVASDERPGVRPMAAQALRALAPDHPETARALLVAVRDADPALRRAALTALAGLLRPSPEVLAALHHACDDPDAASRSLAASACRAIGVASPG